MPPPRPNSSRRTRHWIGCSSTPNSWTPLVRNTIRHAATEALHGVHLEAERARASLQEVHRAALPRVLWMTVGSAAAGLIATLILGACFVPSKEEIAQRQATLAAPDRLGRPGRNCRAVRRPTETPSCASASTPSPAPSAPRTTTT